MCVVVLVRDKVLYCGVDSANMSCWTDMTVSTSVPGRLCTACLPEWPVVACAVRSFLVLWGLGAREAVKP